ncbi:hypothetical protein Tco_0278207 [Tanacetum coccineum]
MVEVEIAFGEGGGLEDTRDEKHNVHFISRFSNEGYSGGGDGEGGLERFSRGVIGDSDRVLIEKKEGFKVVEERLVYLRMEVKFKVLIEKKKMYYLGLRRFDLWMEFLMVHLEELEMKKWW